MSKEKKVKVRDLEKDLEEALKEKLEEATSLLKIKESDKPKEVVEKIREYADKLLSEEYSEDEIKEYALKLGALWGFMVEKEYGWS